jgi:two-component system response regulator PilR (NtrC family)
VFINGESGSGKELAARMIHLKGPRAEFPFIAVNCGAIPENLMESEFFGYRRVRLPAPKPIATDFPGGDRRHAVPRRSRDLPLAMQVKLLRAIQEKKVRKSARHPKMRSTRGSSARRTRTCRGSSTTASFAKTCTTGCT